MQSYSDFLFSKLLMCSSRQDSSTTACYEVRRYRFHLPPLEGTAFGLDRLKNLKFPISVLRKMLRHSLGTQLLEELAHTNWRQQHPRHATTTTFCQLCIVETHMWKLVCLSLHKTCHLYASILSLNCSKEVKCKERNRL